MRVGSKLLLVIGIGLTALIGVATPLLAFGLLVNGGFEETTVDPWVPTFSTVNLEKSSEQSHTGSFSGKVTHISSSARGAEQVVTSISEGVEYQFSGWVSIPEASNSGEVLVKLAWYTSTDGSGSQMYTDDSVALTSTSGFVQLNFTKVAPAGAQSVEVRLHSRSTNGNDFVAYWDDVSFEPLSIEVPMFGPVGMVMAGGFSAGSWWWMKKSKDE